MDHETLKTMVEFMSHEVDHVLRLLEEGHPGYVSPMCDWSRTEWLAYLSGGMATIDRMSNGMCGNISASTRDAIHGWGEFLRRFDKAWREIHKLRGDTVSK